MTKEIREGEPGALAQAIADLGDQGWEMVGCANVADWLHVIYFKRPKA